MAESFGKLPTRQLGVSDMQITRVGFGAWAIGGGDWVSGWGDQNDDDSIAAIRRAVLSGINWIDTAAVYGLGRSEEVVGAALKGLPADRRPYVFTKCGLIWDETNRLSMPRRIGRDDSLRIEVERSLKRLGVERIDLYQMHWPAEDGTRVEDYWRTLLDLKREGKIRAAGLSNHNVGQLKVAENIGHVDSLQPPFSAIRRAVAAAELPWCADHDTGVIVYSPMQSGLLSGAFSKERANALPKNDWRSRSPEFSGEGLTRNLAFVEALRPIAARHETSVAAVAIAWVLAWRGVTAAIVGARKPGQVDNWLNAARLQLTGEDFDDIAAALQQTGAGSGPIRPE